MKETENFGMQVETEKGSFLARRERELNTVWEKPFEREVIEKVMRRRTGTQRPYVEISEEKNCRKMTHKCRMGG